MKKFEVGNKVREIGTVEPVWTVAYIPAIYDIYQDYFGIKERPATLFEFDKFELVPSETVNWDEYNKQFSPETPISEDVFQGIFQGDFYRLPHGKTFSPDITAKLSVPAPPPIPEAQGAQKEPIPQHVYWDYLNKCFYCIGYRKPYVPMNEVDEKFNDKWEARASEFPQRIPPAPQYKEYSPLDGDKRLAVNSPAYLAEQKKIINNITKRDAEYFAGTLDEYQKIATQSAIYPGKGTAIGLMYLALKLNGESGELAEHVGKATRDDHLLALDCDQYASFSTTNTHSVRFNELTTERRDLIIKEIGDVLWYLSAICKELNITLYEAAKTNLEKLADRTERGKLQGDGDKR